MGSVRGIKIALWTISAIWVGIAAWIDFAPRPEDYLKKDLSYREMTKDCEGSYQKRYDCKHGLLLGSQQQLLFEWVGHLSFLFGPPAVLIGGYTYILRRRADRAEEERQKKLRDARARRLESDRIPVRPKPKPKPEADSTSDSDPEPGKEP